MKFRIKARYRIFSLKIAKATGFSSKAIQNLINSFVSNYFFNALYFPLLGYSLLVVYMSEHDFFSYDLLSDSFFAINIFVMTMVAGLMVTMFGMFSSILIYFANRLNGHDIPLKTYWPLLLLNSIFWLSLIPILFKVEDKTFPLSIFAICAFLAVHYSVFIFSNLKIKIILLMTLLILTIGFVFTQPGLSSKVFGNGLRAFGVGGNVSITIYDELSPEGYDAKLLFVTPTTIYFTINNKTGFVPIDKLNRVIEK